MSGEGSTLKWPAKFPSEGLSVPRADFSDSGDALSVPDKIASLTTTSAARTSSAWLRSISELATLAQNSGAYLQLTKPAFDQSSCRARVR